MPTPDRLLGVQIFAGDERSEPLGQIAGASTRWARVQVLWAFIEPTDTDPPTYQWGALDSMFTTLLSAGMTPIGTVYYHPEWAAATRCGPVDRVPLSRYQAFWSAMVERYDGDGVGDAPRAPRVRHWEVMNEPDFNLTFANGEADYGGCFGGNANGYGQLLRAAYLAIKGANPTADVLFGGVAYDRFYNRSAYTPTGPFDYAFVGNVLAWLKQNHGGEPAWPFFDTMAMHVYNDFRNNWDGTLPYNQELIGKVKHLQVNQLFRSGQFDLRNKPISLSEASLPSMPGDAFTERSEPFQAHYAGQMVARAMAVGAVNTIWFSAEDMFTGACDDPYEWLTFGLLRSLTVYQAAQACSPNPLPDYAVSVDHEAKPALTAYRVAGEHLAGYAYDSQLGTALTGSANIEAHRFERAGQYRIVAFTDTGERIGRRSTPPLTRLMGFSAAVFPDWTGRLAIADYLGNTSYVDGSSVWVTLTQAPQYIYPVPLTAASRADALGLRLPRVTLPW